MPKKKKSFKKLYIKTKNWVMEYEMWDMGYGWWFMSDGLTNRPLKSKILNDTFRDWDL